MASIIENLIGVLEEELFCYKKEYDISLNKKDVIINNDIKALQDITKEEQMILGRIQRLEKNRQEIIGDIALVLNKNEEDLTISNIIKLIESSKKEQQQLIKLRDNIFEMVNKVKEENNQIKSLINQSLELIDFTINAVQSKNSMPISQEYGGYGNHGMQPQGRNFFDRRQ